MAYIKMKTLADEEGTFPIKLEFFDETDAAVSPVSATWSLTDMKGAVVNSREDVSISSPDTVEYIVLSGDDLTVLPSDNRRRIVTVEWTYNSSTYGNGLPMKDVIEFKIQDYKVVT